MNAHAISYPSLQRRLIADRRSRALFLPRTTQHVRSVYASSRPHTRRTLARKTHAHRTSLSAEIARAALALAALAAWATTMYVLAA
jgi:hypothetical protein